MPATFAAKVLGQLGGLDEGEERALRVGVGEDRRRGDLRPVFEDHAAHPAAAGVDARHRSARADFDAEGARGGGHRLRDGAHAPDHVAVEALDLVLAAGEQVEQKAERGAGLVGAAVLSVEAVGQHERLDLLGLVVAVEEVPEASRQEGDHPGDLGARDRAHAPADPPELAQAREAARFEVRRRLEEERLKVAGEAFELLVHPHERLRVGGGEPGDRRSTVCARSAHQGRTVPSANGTSRAGSQGTIFRPCAARSRSRITSGRSMLAM